MSVENVWLDDLPECEQKLVMCVVQLISKEMHLLHDSLRQDISNLHSNFYSYLQKEPNINKCEADPKNSCIDEVVISDEDDQPEEVNIQTPKESFPVISAFDKSISEAGIVDVGDELKPRSVVAKAKKVINNLDERKICSVSPVKNSEKKQNDREAKRREIAKSIMTKRKGVKRPVTPETPKSPIKPTHISSKKVCKAFSVSPLGGVLRDDYVSFVCEYCGNVLPTKGLLAIHLQHHLGNKSYQCQKCGKTFDQSQMLREHEVKHKSKKQFICKLCKKSFLDKPSLVGHLAIHQKKMSESNK
ncbi:unnamed protein product [Clavelina lepadiformis]|uniref:C2H2-type domain-containing protein n=1 Tax=Clavelina lepadiformis TaxID=159417 RepID=A0ABP0GLN5_CLALP